MTAQKVGFITPRLDFTHDDHMSISKAGDGLGVVLIGRGNENDKKLISQANENQYPVVVFQPVNKVVPSLPHDVSYFMYKVKQIIRQSDRVVVFRHKDSADTRIAVEFAEKLDKPLIVIDVED